jgi:hypothetical protein
MGLPGNTRTVTNQSATCEQENCFRKAVIRLQGETDSFGAESAELCEECYKEGLAKEAAERAAGTHWMQSAHCDWCKKSGVAVSHKRDTDGEGTSGPVYLVCDPCSDRYDAALAEEYRAEKLQKMGYSSELEYRLAQQDAEDRLWEDEDEARHMNSLWSPTMAVEWKREAFEEAVLGYYYDPDTRIDRLHEAALEEAAARSEYY